MRCSLKQLFLLLLLSVAHAGSVVAQTAQYDTSVLSTDAADTSAAVGNEEEPKVPAIYNASTPTEAEWRQATSDNAYQYRDKKEYAQDDKADEEPSAIERLIERILLFLRSGTGKILLLCGFFLIIGYIVYRIFKGQGSGLFGKRAYAGTGDGDGDVSEESLLENNWDELLRNALASGDTRLSIRYSYMRLLQLLQERSLIAYRADKTNIQYYRELVDSPHRQSFRDLSRQYEYAWYGNLLPSAEAMEKYMLQFNTIKTSLSIT